MKNLDYIKRLNESSVASELENIIYSVCGMTNCVFDGSVVYTNNGNGASALFYSKKSANESLLTLVIDDDELDTVRFKNELLPAQQAVISTHLEKHFTNVAKFDSKVKKDLSDLINTSKRIVSNLNSIK